MLEESNAGIPIFGKTISGLLFVDDLALIGRSENEVLGLLKLCNDFFKRSGMTISCDKSNILTAKDIIGNKVILKNATWGVFEEIKRAEQYKYLGVTMKVGRSASDIFSSYRQLKIAKLKSYKALIFAIARESFNPIEVAEAMWKGIAIESVLYGIEIASITKANMALLDSIQCQLGAALLGVRSSCSHAAILKELGWCNISSTIMKRKLQYWARLCALPVTNWTHRALMEQMQGAWNSAFRKEILEMQAAFHISYTDIGDQKVKKRIAHKVQSMENKTIHQAIMDKKAHSLCCLPAYPMGSARQAYIDFSDESKTLAKFRLGDAGLGNRTNPAIQICPACNMGPNKESHLVFECTALASLRACMPELHTKVMKDTESYTDLDEKLTVLLGGEHDEASILLERGKYITILLDKFHEICATECSEGEDQ